MTTPSAPRISEDELARLEELAGKATPGPWVQDGFDVTYGRRPALSLFVGATDYSASVNKEADAAHIAALSPDVVLRLIAAARSAPAAGLDMERLRRVVERIQARQSLYRLAFSKPRTTRTVLYQQALAFEEWLAQIAADVAEEVR